MDNIVFNQNLKFTWANIITLLALIIVAYFAFVGFSYLTAGNFMFAGIGAAACVIVLAIVFITAQQLKASGKKMHRKIILERILIFGSPLVMVACMIPMSHFWTLHANSDKAVEMFTNTINGSEQIFTDYDAYAANRIKNYSRTLNKIVRNVPANYNDFLKAGFTPDMLMPSTTTASGKDINPQMKGMIIRQKQNIIDALTLQLCSENVTNLKKSATEWINKANTGASVWNVFLIGNLDEISDAINGWQSQLSEFTEKKLPAEDLYASVQPFSSNGASDAQDNINSMREMFKEQQFPTFTAIGFGIVLYLMLLFPYFIQQRHSKSTLSLINKKGTSNSIFNEDKGFEASSSDKTNNNGYNDFSSF